MPNIQGNIASELRDAEASLSLLPHLVEEMHLLGGIEAERGSIG